MTTFSTERQFKHSAAAVFAAIADPTRLAQWWGPNGFTNRFEVFEFQTGGRWVFEMVGPDGTVYPNESVFERVQTNSEVVIHHVCQPVFTLAIRLQPSEEGTRLQWHQTFADAQVAAAVAHIVVPANEQNLDRLEAVLG